MAKPLTFIKRSRIDAPADVVFRWHEQPDVLARLMPPWQKATLEQRPASLEDGERAVIVLHLGPFRKKWIAEHRDYDPPRQFRDVQIKGPFAHWDHRHIIEPDGEQGCYLVDRIEYRPPLGAIGRLLGHGFIERELDRTFTYRHRVTKESIMQQQQQTNSPLQIAVTGSTGLIGSATVAHLRDSGHTVRRIVRPSSRTDESNVIRWEPDAGKLKPTGLDGIDAVIHLSGEDIAGGRWTASRKRAIRESRIGTTRLLSQTLAKMEKPPSTFICASGMNYYGSRGDEEITEDSPQGKGFLAEVCRDWEAVCDPAREKGIRVVNLRTGMVLSAKGGALQKMLLPFKLGVGGVVGDGRQFWSWIALDEIPHIAEHILANADVYGPVNTTAPNPATNREFTKTLGNVLGRPTILPLPTLAAKLALGEMADDLLLSSLRVLPKRLLDSGYQFRFEALEDALRHVLGYEPVTEVRTP